MAYKWTNSAIATATSAAGEDLLLIVDDPSGTPTSKKLTVSNLMQSDAVLEIIRDHFGDVVIQEGTGVTVTVDDPGNTLTVSIGQDVATSASPTFAGLTVNGVSEFQNSITFGATERGRITWGSVSDQTNTPYLRGASGNGSYLTSNGSAAQYLGIKADGVAESSGAMNVNGALTVASDLTLASGSITSASGAISFGNENVSTTGQIGAGRATTTSGVGVESYEAGGTAGVFSTDGTNWTGISSKAAGGVLARKDGTEFSINRYATYPTTGFVGFDLKIDGSGNWDFQAGNLTTTGDLSIGGITKQSVYLDTVITVGTATGGEQGGMELFGSQSSDTVVSALTFNNYLSGTADKRIAQISASRDGSNNSGSLQFTVWSGVDTGALAYEIDTSGNHDFQSGNITTTGTLSNTGTYGWTVGDKSGVFRIDTAGSTGTEFRFLNDANQIAGIEVKAISGTGDWVTTGTLTAGQSEFNSGTGNRVATFTSTDSTAYISFVDDTTTNNSRVYVGAIGNTLQLRGSGTDITWDGTDFDLGAGNITTTGTLASGAATVTGDLWLTQTTASTFTPNGWNATSARYGSAKSTGSGDAGWFWLSSAETVGGAVWTDMSVGKTYIDSIYDNSAGDITLRVRTLGTPIEVATFDDSGASITGTLASGAHVIGGADGASGDLHVLQSADGVSNGIAVENASGDDLRLYVGAGGRRYLTADSTQVIGYDTDDLSIEVNTSITGTLETSGDSILGGSGSAYETWDATGVPDNYIVRVSQSGSLVADMGIGPANGSFSAGMWIQSYLSTDATDARAIVLNPVGGGVETGDLSVFGTLDVSGQARFRDSALTASTTYDDVVIETTGNTGLSILTNSTTGDAGVMLGSQTSTTGAMFRYNETSANAVLATRVVGHSLILRSDANVTNLTLSGASGSELATFAGDVTVGSGSGTVLSAGQNLVVQGTGNSGITIGSGNSSKGVLHFSDPDNGARGFIEYQHSTDTLSIGDNGSSFMTATGGNATFSGDVTLSAGSLTFSSSNTEVATSFISVGQSAQPALEGAFRTFNGVAGGLYARNFANSNSLPLVHLDTSNTVVIGETGVNASVPASLTVGANLTLSAGVINLSTGYEINFGSSGSLSLQSAILELVNDSNPLLLNGSSIRFEDSGVELARMNNGSFILGATSTANNAQFYATQTYSNASGNDIAHNFSADQDAATTGTIRGLYEFLQTSHGSGTVAAIRAVTGYAYVGGAGNVTAATGLYAKVDSANASATIGSAYGLFIDSFSATGTITNGWGIYQAGASESNYLAGDLRIGTTSATGHGNEVLRVLGGNSPQVNFDSGSSGAVYLHVTNSTTGNTSGDGLLFGIDASENAIWRNKEATASLFYTNDTERFRVASDAYAIGIGTTDVESWGATYTALEMPSSSIVGRTNNPYLYGVSNAYFDGGWKYKTAAAASRWFIGDGAVTLSTAASGSADATLTWSEKMRLTNGGMLLVGDTENANMTVGLTLNQGANDDEIISLKSSDVSHGRTGVSETDTFYSIKKRNGAEGGVRVNALAEDAAVTSVYTLDAYGGTADTTKTSSGIGLINFYAQEHDGSNGASNITADGNVLSVQARVGGVTRALFLIDEDGDYHYDGADGGAFDTYEDAHLIRAFSRAVSDPKQVVLSKWDEYVSYNEDLLCEIGVLGAPVKEGGLVNGAMLNRVMVGGIWQNHEAIMDTKDEVDVLRDELAETKSRLAIAESKLKQLPQA